MSATEEGTAKGTGGGGSDDAAASAISMEQAACDQEICTIVGAAGASMDTEDISRPSELEIERASKVSTTVAPPTPNPPSSSSSGGPGSGTGSGGGSGTTSRVEQAAPTAEGIRLKLGGNSGSTETSRKGSVCSTPITSRGGGEVDYPSLSFVRNSEPGLSLDEAQKLTIRLHYNPVMDEWVSLTNESVDSGQDSGQDILFDLHKKVIELANGDEIEVIHMGRFWQALQQTGIRRSDPRLEKMVNNLNDIKNEAFGDTPLESLELDRRQFKRVVRENIGLLSKAFKNQFVIPEFGPFCKQIRGIYERCKENDGGELASYIPQLTRDAKKSKYDRSAFGVSVCTVDGQRFSIGNTTTPFTMQSSSKPFTYGVCLNELGRDTVHQYVGQEPSGRMFNELSLDNNNKPHNPLLNSGAIMSAAILLNVVNPEMKISEKFDFLSDYIQRIAGGEFLSFNNSIFLSERETADRNYALAYYMKENNIFPKGFRLQECLDFYFQTCSMEVTCETMAVLGATLANAGVCPITAEETLKPESVRDVLSLMHSCGMYNYSGQFAFDVGLPAKSGVSGALVLVIPNVMGIGVWSPALDSLGNSVRGVQFAKELVKTFNFHRFDHIMQMSQKKVDPRLFRDESSRQSILCLLYSATCGDLTALKRFHYNHQNVDMTASNYDKRTALHVACAEGHLHCVKFLVETCKLDPMKKDRWGFTPMSEAVRFKHETVVKYLNENLGKMTEAAAALS